MDNAVLFFLAGITAGLYDQLLSPVGKCAGVRAQLSSFRTFEPARSEAFPC